MLNLAKVRTCLISCIIALLVPPEELVGLCISKGKAAHNVHPSEGNQSDHQDQVGPPPLPSQVRKEASFAGVAGVAESRLVVAPSRAVRVSCGAYWADPECWVHKVVAALGWWLAAP